MKRLLCGGMAVAVALIAASRTGRGESSTNAAAVPAGQVTTVWNFLGIPQGLQKIRDVSTNRRGNLPNAERKPALKRIADPENLASDNPTLKSAAKIKADADLKQQKIKALKYLGTIGCCCPTNKDDIKNALLAALSDCDADVRANAAAAICNAAGTSCSICQQCSCCTADVMNKLNQMANGQDEQGCWLEPNEQVRAVACSALNACREARRPTPAVDAPPAQPTPGKPVETAPTPSAPKPKETVSPTGNPQSSNDSPSHSGAAVVWLTSNEEEASAAGNRAATVSDATVAADEDDSAPLPPSCLLSKTAKPAK